MTGKGSEQGGSAVAEIAVAGSNHSSQPCLAHIIALLVDPVVMRYIPIVGSLVVQSSQEPCSDHETSSPPRSIPRPGSLRPALRMTLGLDVGGSSASKLSLRLAELATRGVLAVAGVFGH